MKRTLSFFAILAAIPAYAATITANFTGTVFQTQGAVTQSIGSTVQGRFDIDTVTGNFLDFTIAGQSVAAGYLSSAVFTPGNFDAIYTAQASPVVFGTPSNSSFSLDLSSLTAWPSSETIFSLLTDTAQLTSNLDLAANPLSAFPSTFGYYTANANGTNVGSLNARLTTIAATATPEPSSLFLLGTLLTGLSVFVRYRS